MHKTSGLFESLETRTLFAVGFSNGVLTITGTTGNDSYYITHGAGDKLHVIQSGVSVFSQPRTSVTRIVFSGDDGLEAISCGTLTMIVTGRKSRSTS